MNVLAVGHAPWWPVFPLFWVLVWAGVATLVVRARRHGLGPWRARTVQAPQEGATATAERILAERYARGELGAEEYFERMSVLRSGVL
ncbi:SHOCT domain-containing protein [Streptosporangium saharense]|uniref:SHOCT domain-containing protein n=1 Tax=Streptosporangium saharense TaxID=1706840 RepID=UPI00332BA56D